MLLERFYLRLHTQRKCRNTPELIWLERKRLYELEKVFSNIHGKIKKKLRSESLDNLHLLSLAIAPDGKGQEMQIPPVFRRDGILFDEEINNSKINQ